MFPEPPSASARLVGATVTDRVGRIVAGAVVSGPARLCAEATTVTDNATAVSKLPPA